MAGLQQQAPPQRLNRPATLQAARHTGKGWGGDGQRSEQPSPHCADGRTSGAARPAGARRRRRAPRAPCAAAGSSDGAPLPVWAVKLPPPGRRRIRPAHDQMRAQELSLAAQLRHAVARCARGELRRNSPALAAAPTPSRSPRVPLPPPSGGPTGAAPVCAQSVSVRGHVHCVNGNPNIKLPYIPKTYRKPQPSRLGQPPAATPAPQRGGLAPRQAPLSPFPQPPPALRRPPHLSRACVCARASERAHARERAPAPTVASAHRREGGPFVCARACVCLCVARRR